MIFIFDNGCEYSDHTVYFIDVAEGYVTNDIIEVLSGLRESDRYSLENSYIVAYGQLTFRRKDATMPLHKFLDDYTLFDSDGKLLPCIRKAKKRFLNRLFSEWGSIRAKAIQGVLENASDD